MRPRDQVDGGIWCKRGKGAKSMSLPRTGFKQQISQPWITIIQDFDFSSLVFFWGALWQWRNSLKHRHYIMYTTLWNPNFWTKTKRQVAGSGWSWGVQWGWYLGRRFERFACASTARHRNSLRQWSPWKRQRDRILERQLNWRCDWMTFFWVVFLT